MATPDLAFGRAVLAFSFAGLACSGTVLAGTARAGQAVARGRRRAGARRVAPGGGRLGRCRRVRRGDGRGRQHAVLLPDRPVLELREPHLGPYRPRPRGPQRAAGALGAPAPPRGAPRAKPRARARRQERGTGAQGCPEPGRRPRRGGLARRRSGQRLALRAGAGRLPAPQRGRTRRHRGPLAPGASTGARRSRTPADPSAASGGGPLVAPGGIAMRRFLHSATIRVLSALTVLGSILGAPAWCAITAGAPAPGVPSYQSYTPTQAQIDQGKTNIGYGVSAGEPSVGVDWATGKIMVQSDVQTLRITFDDDPATGAQMCPAYS